MSYKNTGIQNFNMAGIDPKDIIRHELIGLHVSVVDSTDPSIVGVEGRVIDETRNTLVIEKGTAPQKRWLRRTASSVLSTIRESMSGLMENFLLRGLRTG